MLLRVLPRNSGHKWLGCLRSTVRGGGHNLDIDLGLESASRVVFARAFVIFDANIAIQSGLEYCHPRATPLACFAAGHWQIYRRDVGLMDTAMRKFLLRLVGHGRTTIRDGLDEAM